MNLKDYRENPYAWPGGYQINAIMDDGELLCHECVCNEPGVHEDGDADGWRFETAEVYWEGPTLYCANCNKELPSEYGDPSDES